jgi:hypothetical protein
MYIYLDEKLIFVSAIFAFFNVLTKLKKAHYIIFTICGIVLLVHISCTLIFNFDKSTDNTIIQRAVRRYMLPVFSQNNKVFAPNPPLYQQHLLVRYHGFQKGWTEWINPGKTLLDITYINRFSIASVQNKVHEYVLGQLYEAHTISTSYFKTDTAAANNYLITDKRCIMARRYFSDMEDRENHHPLFDKLQYKIQFVYPEKYSAKPVSEIKTDTVVFYFPEMKFTPSIKWVKR